MLAKARFACAESPTLTRPRPEAVPDNAESLLQKCAWLRRLVAAAAVVLVITAGAVLWPPATTGDLGAAVDPERTGSATAGSVIAAMAEVDPTLDGVRRTAIAPAETEDAESTERAGAPPAPGELVVLVLDANGAPVAHAQLHRAVAEEAEGPFAVNGSTILDAPKLAAIRLTNQLDWGLAVESTLIPRLRAHDRSSQLELVLTFSNVSPPSLSAFGLADPTHSGARFGLSHVPVVEWLAGASRAAARPPKLEPLGRTGRDGRCRVACVGALTLLATTTPGATSGLVEVDVPDDGAELVLVVRQSCRVQGLVVDAAGQPLPNARLEADPTASGPLRAREVRGVTTDARGQFSLSVDAPFAFRLRATLGDEHSEELVLDSTPGSALNVRIRMLGAVTLTGVVLDPNGVVISGTDVSLTRLDRDATADARVPHFQASASTDESGAFRILLPSIGAYGIVARHDEWAHSGLEHVDAATAGARTVRLHLRTPATMFGSVRWRDGTAMVGATMTLTPKPHHVPDGLSASELAGDVTTAEVGGDGSYRFDRLLPDVAYELMCVPDPARSHTRAVRADLAPSQQDFVLDRDLLRGAALRLLIEPSNRAAITSASIVVSRNGADGAWVQAESQDVTCERQNEILVDGLERGAWYVVELRTSDFGRCRTAPFVAGTDLERVLRPQPAGRLEVTVLDTKGRPVFAAKVIAREEAAPGLRPADSIKVTDLRGLAVWPSISVLPWTISAEHGGKRSPVTPVVIESNGVARLELRLPAR